MVRCPFHGDRNPSLSLNLSKGLWKCHSCGKGGDAVSWLQASGYSKQEALNRGKPNAPKKERGRQDLIWTGPDGSATQYRLDLADGSKKIWWEKGAQPKRLLYLGSNPVADRDPSRLVFCEGAKAAAAVAAAGFAAVGIAAAEAPPAPDVLNWLHNKESDRRIWILWPDNDPGGRSAMRTVKDRLPTGVTRLRAAAPDRKPKDDAADCSLAEIRVAVEMAVSFPEREESAVPTTQADPPDFEKSDLSGEYGCEPADMARRLLLRFPSEMLVYDDGKSGGVLFLDRKTGIWTRSATAFHERILEVYTSLRKRIVASALGSRSELLYLRKLDRLKHMAVVGKTSEVARSTLEYLQGNESQHKDLLELVTECNVGDLDAKLRYLGAKNGVIDLHNGRLLCPAEGRKALVTFQCPTKFDPEATSPDVDRLFSHLSPELRRYWWRVLGYHLQGRPTRRAYFLIGETSGGKTTVFEALKITLGPYAVEAKDQTLGAEKRGTEALSPALEAFTLPRRLVLFDEIAVFRVDSRVFKRLTGDGSISYRRLHENLRTGQRATATPLIACNTDPANLPKLSLHEGAMVERVRELPYPAIPKTEVDPEFGQIIRTRQFRRAFLARLVKASATEEPGHPPKAPEVVRVATKNRIELDIGEVGEFSRRFVRDDDEFASIGEVWEQWCQHNGEFSNAKNPGGIGRRKLSSELRSHVRGLPPPKQVRWGGKNQRGWKGWRLLSLEEFHDQVTTAEGNAEPALWGDWDKFHEIFSKLPAADTEKEALALTRAAAENIRVRALDGETLTLDRFMIQLFDAIQQNFKRRPLCSLGDNPELDEFLSMEVSFKEVASVLWRMGKDIEEHLPWALAGWEALAGVGPKTKVLKGPGVRELLEEFGAEGMAPAMVMADPTKVNKVIERVTEEGGEVSEEEAVDLLLRVD